MFHSIQVEREHREERAKRKEKNEYDQSAFRGSGLVVVLSLYSVSQCEASFELKQGLGRVYM